MHPSRQDRPAKLESWKKRLAAESVAVPVGRGALWSGVGALNAQRLALEMGLITLEMTPLGASLDHGPLKEELDKDFGTGWIAEKREIFKVASLKFVEALHGRVTIFLPADIARPNDGAAGSFAYAVKIVWNELGMVDFGDPRTALHQVTEMRLCRVLGGQVVSDTFMNTSSYVH